jgi:ketosteroid isomerase-like protein
MSTSNAIDSCKERDRKSAFSWAQQFAASVRDRNFENGASLFACDAHGFGTRCREARSLAELLMNQWQPTWPRTTDFDYVPDSVHVQLSDDSSMALVTARWQSLGVDHSELWGVQIPYRRSGRCTFVLKREQTDTWCCTHSHFSMDPDIQNPP